MRPCAGFSPRPSSSPPARISTAARSAVRFGFQRYSMAATNSSSLTLCEGCFGRMADCQTWTHQVETALVRPTWVRSRIKRVPGINVGFEGFKGTAQGVDRMSGNVTKLKPKQEEAIIALLTNRSVEDAARSVNVAPRTLYRWRSEEHTSELQ